MMKNKNKIFGLSLLLIFSLLIFPNIGMACFNPTDSFATEVALNKPFMTYDLSGIKQSKEVKVIEKEKSHDIVEGVHKEETAPKPIIIKEGVSKKGNEPSFENYFGSATIYRSHYNKDVAVVLTEEEWADQKYLDIKIQVPTKRVHKKMDYVEIVSIANVDIASFDINASEDLGWDYKISGGGCYHNEELDKQICRDSYSLDKGNIHIYLTSEGRVSTEKTEVRIIIDNTKELKTDIEFNEKCSWVNIEKLKNSCCIECKNAFSKTPIGVGPEVAMCGKFSRGQPMNTNCKLFFEDNPMSVSACQSYLETAICDMIVGYYYDSKKDECVVLDGCEKPAGTPFNSLEECETNCKKEAGYQIAEVLVKIGFSKDIKESLQIVKNNAEHKINEWEDLESAISINPEYFDWELWEALESAIDDPKGFDWKTALMVELEWLRDNNVIGGLTDDDIYGIIKVANKGTAGWNSKIRYFNGEWVQGITEEMSEETGMYMVKSLGSCGGFPIDTLPNNQQSSTDISKTENVFIIGVIVVIALIVSIIGFVLYKKK